MTPRELKDWRKKNQVTQLVLAEYLGTTRITVGRWEVGTHPIPSFLELALAELERRLSDAQVGQKTELKGGEKNDGRKGKRKT